MRYWYFWMPGNVYAYGPIPAKDLRHARAWVRDWLNVKRLPRGVQVWEKSGGQ